MTATAPDRALPAPSGVVSVRELVRRRLGEEPDPWNLALVQRDEVWDHVRMRHLLDSLIAGYPIGAILLCRVATPSQVLIREGSWRVVAEAKEASWQLLDGQQRINALFSMFTDRGRYGRFYLRMTVEREPPGPVVGRSRKSRALEYIAWRDDAAHDQELDPLYPRDEYVDLSRWYEWAEGNEATLTGMEVRPHNVASLLRQLDPDFATALDHRGAEVAAHRLARLIDAWTRNSIPVLRAEVQDPLDVLEIYTRINLGGVQVTGADVYFAAVKTFWNQAEQRLDHFADSSEFLNRMSALGLVSRLASRGVGQGDIVPLSVDRIAGERGRPIIAAMEALTEHRSPVIDRISRFSRVYRDRSQLGLGLKAINQRLWDEVLAWVGTSSPSEDAWYAENTPIIDAYLLGATLFRYQQILGGRYQRAAFLQALVAGIRGEAFPLERIVSVARGGGNGLRGSRQVVLGLQAEQDRLAIADAHPWLVLSVAQRLPYNQQNIDWDHIFPVAQAARRMWARSEYGRRMHHPLRRRVNSIGNLWALDAGTNRALQDMPPIEKFPQLYTWQKAPAGFPVWPDEQWALNSDETDEFKKVDRLLTDDVDSIDAGMTVFDELVTSRTLRLLDEILDRFPPARLFAADAAVGASDLDLEPRAEITAALKVEDAAMLAAEQVQVDQEPGIQPRELSLDGRWRGREYEVMWVVKDVTKRHTPTGRRALPSGRSHGFDFRRFFDIGNLGNRRESYLIVGVVNAFANQTGELFWLQVWRESGAFEALRRRLLRSSFATSVRTDEHGLWIPLPVTPDLEWTELADRLDVLVQEIRDVVEVDPDQDLSSPRRVTFDQVAPVTSPLT